MPFLLPLFLLQVQNNTENLYADKQDFHSLLYSTHHKHHSHRHKRAITLCGVMFLTWSFVDENERLHIFPCLST
jgi:biotin synthase-like enzyme